MNYYEYNVLFASFPVPYLVAVISSVCEGSVNFRVCQFSSVLPCSRNFQCV